MRKIDNPLDSRELIALFISAAIVLAALCYWVVQIDGVRAMLKLAHA